MLNNFFTYLASVITDVSIIATAKIPAAIILLTFGFTATANQQTLLDKPINKPLKTNKVAVKESVAIEKIQVIHSRSLVTIDKSLTSDNSYIEATEYTRNQNSFAEIIQQSSGVSLNGQGGLFQSYNIRGFSRSRIKTEVNGIPIITDRRAGNSISFLPAALISHVDIKKGPSSTLYGSDAMGGVVSLSTINFDDSTISIDVKPQADAIQLYANLATEKISATFLQRKANNTQSAKLADNSIEELNSQYQQFFTSIASKFTWKNIDIQSSTLFSQGKDIGKSSAEFPTGKITLYPTDDHWLSKIQFSQHNDWQLSFYHHMQGWQSDIKRLETEQPTIVARENITDYQSDTFGSLGLINWKNMILGMEWLGRRNIKISERELDNNAQLVWQKAKVNASEDTLALFAQHAVNFKNVQLNTGIRYDWQQVKQHQSQTDLVSSGEKIDKINDDFISLSIHGQYAITPQTQLGLTVANAFRFPSVSELFFSGETPRGNTQGNSALKPEESIGYQLDFEHNISPDLALSFHSYYYQITNYIERYQLETVNSTDLRSYRNSDEVIIQGFELGANWQANSTLSNQFSYQKQLARDINKHTVDDALPEMLKWQLYWYPEHPYLEKVNLENQFIYQFKKTTFGDSEQALPASLIWHASLNYQFSEQQKLTLSLANITNKAYRASADEDAALQAERTISLKWHWQFN